MADSDSDIEIVDTAGFDPRALKPVDGAPRATTPALFIIAGDDEFVAPRRGRRTATSSKV